MILIALIVLCVCRRPATARRRANPGQGKVPVFCRRKPDWVVQRVVRIKALSPHLGCRLIAASFNGAYGDRMTVSKSWVATTLRNHAYQVKVERELVRKRQLRPGKPNRVWGIDLTGVTDTGGKTHTVFGAVDHGTRRLLKLRRVESKRSVRLLWELALTCLRFGRPRFVRTDNEAVFRSRRFRLGLRLMGMGQPGERSGRWTNAGHRHPWRDASHI